MHSRDSRVGKVVSAVRVIWVEANGVPVEYTCTPPERLVLAWAPLADQQASAADLADWAD